MKKLLYLLLLLPLGFMVSCSSEDDLPDVDIAVSFDNVVSAENTLYVVQGDTLKVKGVAVRGNDNKNAIITNVSYMWDGLLVTWNPIAPFGVNIMMDFPKPGRHVLSIYMDIAQEDKSLAYGILEYKVTVVGDSTELPAGPMPGPYTSISYMGTKQK